MMPVRFVLRAVSVLSMGLGLAAIFNGCEAFGVHSDSEALAPDASLDASYRECREGGVCNPDPGSRATDCSVASGLETLPIVTFDDVGTGANVRNGFNKAENMYEYNDNTAIPYFSNGQSLCAATGPAVPGTLCGFEPWTEPSDLCRSGNYVLHVMGGPFLGWGGGMGVSMQKLNGRDTVDGDANKALCTPRPGQPLNPVCPPDDAEYAIRVASLDVSQYDGVSFWARRGPQSQAGFLVAVGDKYTDDDLNYLANRHGAQMGVPEPRYCERVKECGCLYEGGCNYVDSLAQFWCRDPFDPKTLAQCGGIINPDGDTVPAASSTSGSVTSLNGVTTNCLCNAADVCNTSYSAFPNDAPIGPDGMPVTSIDPRSGKAVLADTAFYGRACTPYSFPDGTGTSFCFDPARDPPPAPGSQRCGDHWTTGVNLSLDWKFYKIPFSDLRQQGFAKKAPTLDLHTVSVVRFTWGAGYIEYFIDALSFYKNPK
jgi:hypothetical protein